MNINETDVLAPSHLQFKMDEQIDIINEVSRQIMVLQCESKKMKHFQAITVAHFNTYLAAKYLNLPLCSRIHPRIHPIGDFALIEQCDLRTLRFKQRLQAVVRN